MRRSRHSQVPLCAHAACFRFGSRREGRRALNEKLCPEILFVDCPALSPRSCHSLATAGWLLASAVAAANRHAPSPPDRTEDPRHWQKACARAVAQKKMERAMSSRGDGDHQRRPLYRPRREPNGGRTVPTTQIPKQRYGMQRPDRRWI